MTFCLAAMRHLQKLAFCKSLQDDTATLEGYISGDNARQRNQREEETWTLRPLS